MKTKQILLGAWAFAALGAMTSCSNEEILGSSGAAEQQGDRYMAVRISATGTSSRAGENDKLASDPADKREYEGAEENIENTIAGPEALRFYFFSQSGEPFYLSTATVNGTVENTNMVTPQTITPVYDQLGNETASNDAVLVLGKPSAPHLGTVPSLVVVAANLTDPEFKSLANKNLNNMKDVFTSYEQVAAVDNKTTPFKMTTAVYANTINYDGTTGIRTIMATLIPEKSICETPNAAKLSPVVCNIERLAAKVRVKGLGVYPVKEKSIKKDEHGNPILDTNGEVQWGAPEVHTYEWIAWKNGTTVKESGPLYMNLCAWKLCDVYKNVKLIKNINPHDVAEPFPNWNDPANKRCYWAVTPASADAGQLLQTSINIYDDTDFPFENYNPGADTKKGEMKNMVYVTPNAAMDWQPSSPTDREQSKGSGTVLGSTTSIVVLGKVCTDAEGLHTIDLMRWSGTYYTPDALKELVAQSYNAKQAATVQPVTRDQIDFVLQNETGKDRNKYVAVVKPLNTQELETDKNNNYSVVAEFSDISWWKDGGRTSYWQNIQHAVKADGTPLYGVIRNHIYDYNMTGVVGLGLPGNSRENPDPEDESFVACDVHVLNWRVLSKDVVLE